jgi:hypothetical protein
MQSSVSFADFFVGEKLKRKSVKIRKYLFCFPQVYLSESFVGEESSVS